MTLGQRVVRWIPIRVPAPHRTRFPRPVRWRIAVVAITLIAATGAVTNNAAAPFETSRGPAPVNATPSTPPPHHHSDAAACDETETVHTHTGEYCTHGDDTQFEASETDPLDQLIAAATASLTPDTARLSIPCHGDGSSGNRILFVYAYLAGHSNRITQVKDTLRDAIYRANGIVNASAAQTGGHRYLRVRTDSNCVPIIVAKPISAWGEASFDNTISYLQTKYGFKNSHRKYVVFGDFRRFCGIGTIAGDDRRGLDNQNNRGPSYARVDSGCWNSHTVAHEIFHNLGAVQMSAPHSDNTWHCTDTYDLMCYNAGGKSMVMRCTNSALYMRADCGHNDYFSTSPSSGSYLATHWNAASNSFLYGGGPPYMTIPGGVSTLTASMTSATSARVAWSKASGTVYGYLVYRDGVRVYKGTARAWTDPVAITGQTTYRVRAYNAAGVGNWSATATATLTKPGAPTGLSVQSVPFGTQVSWTAATGVVDGYRLYGVPYSGYRTRVITATLESVTLALDSTQHSWSTYQVCAYNAAGETCTTTP